MKRKLLIDPETGEINSLLETEYLTAKEILEKYPRRMINPKTYVKLKQLRKEKRMKKGQKINVIDGSGTLTIENGKLEPNDGIRLGLEKHVIIATRIVVPGHDDYSNDTVIQGVESGKVTFIRARFCELADPNYCGECGKKL